MELSMDNMDIVAGGILAIMLALFMLTVIVTLFALSHRIRLLSNEIYKIEKQVSDYIDELSRSESDKLEIEHKALVEAVQAAYPDFEVEAHAGGQPIYYYILSLE